MHPDEFTFVVESIRGTREALVSIWKAAMAADWVVIGDYDLSGILGDEGSVREVKSIDICKPELARPFVQADMLTALCMPCNVLIYSENNVTKLAAIRPSVMLPHLFAETARTVGDLPQRIDRELKAILEAAR